MSIITVILFLINIIIFKVSKGKGLRVLGMSARYWYKIYTDEVSENKITYLKFMSNETKKDIPEVDINEEVFKYIEEIIKNKPITNLYTNLYYKDVEIDMEIDVDMKILIDVLPVVVEKATTYNLTTITIIVVGWGVLVIIYFYNNNNGLVQELQTAIAQNLNVEHIKWYIKWILWL